MWQSQLFWAPAKRARQIRSLDWYTYEQWCRESTISHYQWSNTRNNTFRNERYLLRKILASSARNEVSVDIFWRAKEQQSYVCNLLSAYTRYWMQKGDIKQGYLRWQVVMFCWWIRLWGCQKGSTSFGLWLAKKLQNPITDPEFRASAKGTISYYGAGIRPVKGDWRNRSTNGFRFNPMLLVYLKPSISLSSM